MQLEEIIVALQELGTEQTRNTFIRHGAKEPLFGVKVRDLKKFVKHVKKDQELALALYETGNFDAMYLAGLSVNAKLMSKETLQDWVRGAYWYMLAEYTVAGVTAESNYALELAREWMQSPEEMIAVSGWSTYGKYISITPDKLLDIEEIKSLLKQIKETIHDERNRVRYVMNEFVIGVGAFVQELHEEAVELAKHIGNVHVDVGNTACKVPLATEYIQKIAQKGSIGKKKKTSIC